MKIIIVGCGKIGSTVIDSLVEEGHDVVAIDTDEKVVNEIMNVYDIMGVCGSGTDYGMLEEAGARSLFARDEPCIIIQQVLIDLIQVIPHYVPFQSFLISIC